MLIIGITLLVLVVLLVLYFLFIRPWQIRWGATDDEVAHSEF